MILRIKLSIVFFAILFSSCTDENEQAQKLLFDRIKVGMTQDEVINILGKPAYIDIDSGDTKKIRYYYQSSDNNLHSSAPSVYFDSTGKVTFSTYGDGG